MAMDGEAKALLILTVADIVVDKGLPALSEFINSLSNKVEAEPVTVADIVAVKGDLDSASYFE